MNTATYFEKYVKDANAIIWLTARRVKPSMRVYMTAVDGNAYDALMLHRIMYWHDISDETGKPRISHVRDGNLWIVKTHKEWAEEIGYNSTKTVRNVLDRLEKKGFIFREYHKSSFSEHNGQVVSFVRVNWSIVSLFQRIVAEIENGPEIDDDDSEVPIRDIQEVPERDIQEVPEKALHNTIDTTIETTTESLDFLSENPDFAASDEAPDSPPGDPAKSLPNSSNSTSSAMPLPPGPSWSSQTTKTEEEIDQERKAMRGKRKGKQSLLEKAIVRCYTPPVPLGEWAKLRLAAIAIDEEKAIRLYEKNDSRYREYVDDLLLSIKKRFKGSGAFMKREDLIELLEDVDAYKAWLSDRGGDFEFPETAEYDVFSGTMQREMENG